MCCSSHRRGCGCGCGCGNNNSGIGGATTDGYVLVCARVAAEDFPVTLPSYPEQGVGGTTTGSSCGCGCHCHCIPHCCRG